MSSFPISITWQVAAPPTGSFDQLASAAQKLDSALQASGQKFDQFGSTIEQLESPLGSVGSSMGELGDNMEGLDSSLGSSGDAMGELAGATEDLNGSIGETGGFIEDAAGGMDDLSTGAEGAGGALEDMSGSLETTNTGLEDTTTALEETVPALEDTTTGLEDTSTALEDTVPALEDTNTALEDTVPALEDTATALEDTVPAAEDTATAFEDAVPAIEDTATALEDTAPALEDTSTALGDMGTAIESDVTAADDFTGALSGMNDANEGVTGGLTTNNTLMGNLAGATSNTTGSTNALTGSFGRAALGMAGAVGAGVALFNMYDQIGDSQVQVDAANIRLERSQTMVDKAMLAMSRTLAKLNGDMSLGISGLGEYNAAFRAFNSLVESGVTSGATYEAALTRLQAAHRGLTSSTAEGQRLISQLGIQMDTASQKIGLTAVAENNLANSQEALNEATVNFYANSIPTLIAGLGSLATTISDLPKAMHQARSALTVFGGILGTTVVPALIAAKVAMVAMAAAIAPVAIPIGIVIGALAAFTAAVTAIRANIKVFDDLGVKVGEVFPEMKGFLDDARQAFINLSDGLNTAISVALGAIDQMTGSVANLQAQWDGFTNTLPKGTGELGNAGLAMGQLGHITSATGEQINIGAGKWQNMNGTLVAFGGAVKVAAGGWHELADGTAVYSKSANEGTSATIALATSTDQATTAADAYGASAAILTQEITKQASGVSEMTNAQKLSVEASNTMIESLSKEKEERYKTFLVADQYLRQIEKITPAVGLSMAAITGMAQGLREEAGAHADAVTEAAAYIATKDLQFLMVKQTDAAILAYAEKLKEEEKATAKVTEETAKHVAELQKLQTTLQENAAELGFYADAGNLAARMQLEFSIGVQEAELNLIKQEAALARNLGTLQGNLQLLDEGRIQELAYAEGVFEATNAIVTKTEALFKAEGAYDRTNALMQEGTLLALEFATGMQDTKTAVQENALEVVNLAGQLEAYSDAAVRSQADNAALMKGFIDQKQALSDLYQEYASVIGATEALRMALEDTASANLRFNLGIAEGTKKALEFMTGMNQAKGEAIGFRTELLAAATKISGGMIDMSRKSTEALQQIIEVANGVPGAFEKVVQGIDAMGQKIISTLTDAAQESREKFMDEIEAMEKDLGEKFSEPIVQELYLQARVEDARRDVETAMGVLASMLRDKPLEVALETQAAQDALKLLQGEVNKAAALSPKFQPLQTALNNLAAWTPAQGLTALPVLLTDVLQSAQGLEGGMQGVIQQFDGMFSSLTQSVSGLEAMKTAFQSVGLSFDTLTGKVTDGTGKQLADYQVLGEGAGTAASEIDQSLLLMGASGDAARDAWARDMQIMFFAVDQFGKHAQTMAITVSGAFSNMSTNVTASLNRFASGLIVLLASFTRVQTDSQRMASTVSGSFNNMAANAISSMNRMASGIIIIISSFTRITSEAGRMNTAVSSAMSQMASRTSSFASSFSSAMSRVGSSAASATSKVKALQSSINALKSKTITITTIIRTVRQTVFAAAGGAFIQSNPGKVGPLSVSEFGQKELVTVTPMETPGRNAVKGISNLIQDAADKKRRRAMDEDKGTGEGKPSGRKEVVMMRELPIIIQVDGREISRVVNKRIFEESDALT